MKTRYLSPTQISMWCRCPRQWEFRYVKGLKVPPSGMMFQGRAYHSALATNFKNKFEKLEDMPVDDVVDAYDTYWEAFLRDHRVNDEDEKDEQVEFERVDWEDREEGEVKDEGIVVLKEYMKKVAHKVTPSLLPEQRKTKKIPRTDIELVTVPDLITTKVIDHKLAGRRKSQADADNDIQASLYLYITGLREFEWHVGVRKTIPEIQIVETGRTDYQIDWWVDLVKDVAMQMNTGICPPNPMGWHCSEKFCGYWNLCRGGSE